MADFPFETPSPEDQARGDAVFFSFCCAMVKTYSGAAERLRAEGRLVGLGILERQFARRLGRPLTAVEHVTLLIRLRIYGFDPLCDAVLDRRGNELAAWITDTNAP